MTQFEGVRFVIDENLLRMTKGVVAVCRDTAVFSSRRVAELLPSGILDTHWASANKSHQPAQPSIKMKGVAVGDAGRVSLDGKVLKFLLWNDDPERLRRRCASVARPSGSPGSKRSSGFLPARSLNP